MSAQKRTSRTKVFNVCFLEASKHAKKGHAAFDRALHTCIVRKAGGKAYGGVKVPSEYRNWKIEKVEGIQLGYRLPPRGASCITTPGKGRKCNGYTLVGPDGAKKFVSTIKQAKEYIDQYEGS